MVKKYLDTAINNLPNMDFDPTHFSHNDLRNNKFQVEFHEYSKRDGINLKDITKGIVGFDTPSISNKGDTIFSGNFQYKIPQNEITWGDGNIVFRITDDLALYLYIYHNMLMCADNPSYDHTNDSRMRFRKYRDIEYGLDDFRMDIHLIITDNHNNPIWRLVHEKCWFNSLSSLQMNVLDIDPKVMFNIATFSCDKVRIEIDGK